MTREDAEERHKEHLGKAWFCPTINGECRQDCRYYVKPVLVSSINRPGLDDYYNAEPCRCDYNVRCYNEEEMIWQRKEVLRSALYVKA